MHLWFAQTVLVHFGSHEHVCVSLVSGLAYTCVILTAQRACIPFISLELVMLTVTLNKFMLSYGDTYVTGFEKSRF